MRPVLLAVALLFLCNVASAHHSFAMYDLAQLIHIRGSVKAFEWTNPHVMVWVTKDQDPAGEVWTIELPTSPGNLARMGWSKHSLKVGDKVDVEVSPLRDGQHAGSFKKATFVETGEVLLATMANVADAGAAAALEPAPAQNCADTSDESHESMAATASRPTDGCACADGKNGVSCAASAFGLALLTAALFARRFRRAA